MPRAVQAGQDGTWSQRAAGQHLQPFGGSKQSVGTAMRRLGIEEPLTADDVVVLQAVFACGGWLTDELEQQLVLVVRDTLAGQRPDGQHGIVVVIPGLGPVCPDPTEGTVDDLVRKALARGQAALVLPVTAWLTALDIDVRAARAAAEQLVDLATARRLPADLADRLRQALEQP